MNVDLHIVARKRWLGLLLLTAALPDIAAAQQFIPGGPLQASAPSDVFPQNSNLGRQLLLAREELAKKDYRVGLRRLGLIVGSEPVRGNPPGQPTSEDHFFSDKPDDLASFRSLKAAARGVIAGLPPEGRAVYEDLYGRVAQVELDAALAEADVEKVAEIARKYFHTAAGYEAAYHVAAHHMDHGHPMAAVRIFNELLAQPQAAKRWEPMLSIKTAICWSRAGRTTEAATVLAGLKNGQTIDQIVLGGTRQPLILDAAADATRFDELFGQSGQTEQPINDYKLLGGNPARTQPQTDTFPFMRPLWTAPATENSGVQDILSHWKRALDDAEDLCIPALRPLLVDDLVIVKTLGDEEVPTGSKVSAYDRRTGALRWQTFPDATYDPMPPNPQLRAEPFPSEPEIKRNTVAEQRAWHDHTFADLASDGDLVFSVEELDVLRTSNSMSTAPLRPYNLLRAYDVRNGKALWEVGGSPGQTALPLAGTFFLGSPLPLDGELLCIVEQDRHIRLLALDPANGEQLWSQSLFVVNSERQSLVLDIWRRVAGLSPAYSQGLIICPTGIGGVVAFDSESRELQWHFTYRNGSNRRALPRGFNANPMAQRMMPGQEGQRWLNSTPMIAAGRVLIAPQDDRDLYCLDVLTGKLLWRKQQSDRLQIVGIHDGNVVVLGKNEIEMFQLDSGRAVFKKPISIPRPSGRAALAGGKVLVPLSTASLIAVDLATGEITKRAISPDGAVPGNLLCLPDAVISQGLTAMMVFEDLAHAKQRVAEKLHAAPDDVAALLAKAEIAQQEGNLDEAVTGFRRVAELTNDPAAKRKLLDLLLEGLQEDFANYEPYAAEIQALLDAVPADSVSALPDDQLQAAISPGRFEQELKQSTQPDRRAMFLRRLGQGYAAIGKTAAAFDAYLTYAPPDADERFDELEPGWGIRRDRWFAARISELMREASPDQQAAITQQAEQELTAALNPKNAEQLRRFVIRYADHPLVEKALRAMVDATADGVRPLETELALFRLRRYTDEKSAAFATAKLAALAIDFDRYAVAAPYLKDLRSFWGATPVFDDKTGNQLVESWSQDPLVARPLSDQSSWPTGRVEVNEEKKNTPTQSIGQPVLLMEVRERHSPPIALKWSAPNGTSSMMLTAQNGDTQQVWSINVPTAADGRVNYNSHARACGDLIVLLSGNEILAVDSLGWHSGTGTENTQQATGQVLWRKYLNGPYPQPVAAPRNTNAWGIDPRGRRMGELGPVTTQAVFYQSGRSIFAVDTMTGETLWQRGGIEYNSRLFADEQRLMVVSSDGKTAAYYSMIDGTELGTREHIPGKQLVAAVDGNVLGLEFIDDQLVMTMQHVWSGDLLWKREFAQQSHYVRIGYDEIAVLQPDGRLTVFNIADGNVLFETKITYVPGTKSLTILPGSDIYTVIVNHPIAGENNRTAVPSNPRQIQVNGTVYGIARRTGQLLWSQTVAGQAIDTQYPSDIPLLVFTNRVVTRIGMGRFTFAVLCLDKRSGRKVFETTAAIGPVLDYEADEPSKTVTLDMGRSTLRFTFTDEPVEAEATAPAESSVD